MSFIDDVEENEFDLSASMDLLKSVKLDSVPKKPTNGHTHTSTTPIKPSTTQPRSTLPQPIQSTSPTHKASTTTPSSLTDIKQKMLTLKQTIQTKDNTITELQSQIQSLRSELDAKDKSHQRTLKHTTAALKKEYEPTIQRHLTFIDKLLADKQELNTRCETLTLELQKQSATLQEEFERRVRKEKELWSKEEKQRRDTWMTVQTKAIKQSTVASLEPELQKLIAKSREELQRAEQDKQDALSKQQTTFELETEKLCTQLKGTWLTEKENIVEKERSEANARLKELEQKFEQQLKEQKVCC